jgi:hypothetical protein
MVNALVRRFPESVPETKENVIGVDFSNDQALKLPCALREFINSNADLPTIDELARKSKTLAMAMGLSYLAI